MPSRAPDPQPSPEALLLLLLAPPLAGGGLPQSKDWPQF